jgi:hypothetical protein
VKSWKEILMDTTSAFKVQVFEIEIFCSHSVVSDNENCWSQVTICIMEMVILDCKAKSTITQSSWGLTWVTIAFHNSCVSFCVDTVLSSVPVEANRGDQGWNERFIHDCERIKVSDITLCEWSSMRSELAFDLHKRVIQLIVFFEILWSTPAKPLLFFVSQASASVSMWNAESMKVWHVWVATASLRCFLMLTIASSSKIEGRPALESRILSTPVVLHSRYLCTYRFKVEYGMECRFENPETDMPDSKWF